MDQKFKEIMQSMQQIFLAVTTKIDSLSKNHERSSDNKDPHKNKRDDNNFKSSTVGTCRSKMVKMNFSKFSGYEDPTSWIYEPNNSSIIIKPRRRNAFP